MENKEYRELLERSIVATETSANAIKILSDNSKALNDNLASHNATMKDIYTLALEGNAISTQNNKLLLKYLKWAIIMLVIVLGGSKLFAEAKMIIANYVL
jgi:hypothetical protein